MQDFQTTVSSERYAMFYCTESNSNTEELTPVQADMKNAVLSFRKYVYRYLDLGSETLVERGRELIMQKVVVNAGIGSKIFNRRTIES